ncbi:MAG: ATP-binding protein [Synergistaceae bacterium]|nr:ATP-binding protein [Synergistaceae bacterium]
MKELEIAADINNLDEVLAFIDADLEENDCPPKTQMQLDVAIEELFVNIAHYSGSERAIIQTEINSEIASITFIDSGVYYDPLAKPDPDVTLSAEERQIGGLGIYLVKKSMDSMNYERRDDKNILTITKRLS